MARDAFGREQEKDTLEDIGWSADGPPRSASPGPVAAAPPAPPAPRTPAAAGPTLSPSLPTTFAPPSLSLPNLTPRRHRGGGIAALFGLVVAGALVFGVISVIKH